MSSNGQPSTFDSRYSKLTTEQSESDQEVRELNAVTYEEFIEAEGDSDSDESEKTEKRQKIEKIMIEYLKDNSIPSSKNPSFEIAE